MDDSEEIKRRYLLLFGLRAEYDADELLSAYRTLAKLNHPDVAVDADAGARMVIINEGYRFLKGLSPRPPAVGRKEVFDPYYEQYRSAFRSMASAFDDYFGEGGRKELVGNLKALQGRLKEAKSRFAVLVEDMDYNPYVDDAIDRIAGINKWLG